MTRCGLEVVLQEILKKIHQSYGPILGASICWGHCVVQKLALVEPRHDKPFCGQPFCWFCHVAAQFIFALFRIKHLKTNSVDPYHMPCCVASDLGLHCLPMSHLGNRGYEQMGYCCYYMYVF